MAMATRRHLKKAENSKRRTGHEVIISESMDIQLSRFRSRIYQLEKNATMGNSREARRAFGQMLSLDRLKREESEKEGLDQESALLISQERDIIHFAFERMAAFCKDPKIRGKAFSSILDNLVAVRLVYDCTPYTEIRALARMTLQHVDVSQYGRLFSRSGSGDF